MNDMLNTNVQHMGTLVQQRHIIYTLA